MSRRVGKHVLEWDDDYEVEFFGNPKDARYYGVELEIDDGRSENLRRRMNGDERLDNQIFLVEDGSLDNGLEIVSNPMSLMYHKETKLWRTVTEHAKNAGYSSHDNNTCGLHVHVSRNALTRDTIDNLLFINERFWQKWVTFSRRDPDRLDRWASKLTSYNEFEVTKDNVKDTASRSKYNAINLSGEDTVEFRIYKGTLAPRTIYATLDMIDYMIDVAEEYADTTDLDINDMTWSGFIKGISEDSVYLRDYLKKYDLLYDNADKEKLELLEREKYEKKQVVKEVRELSTSLLYGGDFDNDLISNTDAVNSFTNGDRAPLYAIDANRLIGDLVTMHSVEDNPHGRGVTSNFDEVMVYSQDVETGDGTHQLADGYHYENSIASKLIKVNPITVYNIRGRSLGEFEYAVLDHEGNLALCNLSRLSVLIDFTRFLDTYEIRYTASPDNVLERIGPATNTVLEGILRQTEPERIEAIPLSTYKDFLLWVTDVAKDIQRNDGTITADVRYADTEWVAEEISGNINVFLGEDITS